jgi:hypothetical protein
MSLLGNAHNEGRIRNAAPGELRIIADTVASDLRTSIDFGDVKRLLSINWRARTPVKVLAMNAALPNLVLTFLWTQRAFVTA